MNPYRAALIPTAAVWPWWCCPEPRRFRFTEHLNSDRTPPAEWLGTVEETAKHIIASQGRPYLTNTLASLPAQ